MHIILIIFCTLLLLGDFLTTSMALSLLNTSDKKMDVIVAEGNPVMAQIACTPILFLSVKAFILLVVIAAAYVLRKEGAMAYLPYVLVCSFYIWVNINNINVLTAVFI